MLKNSLHKLAADGQMTRKWLPSSRMAPGRYSLPNPRKSSMVDSAVGVMGDNPAITLMGGAAAGAGAYGLKRKLFNRGAKQTSNVTQKIPKAVELGNKEYRSRILNAAKKAGRKAGWKGLLGGTLLGALGIGGAAAASSPEFRAQIGSLFGSEKSNNELEQYNKLRNKIKKTRYENEYKRRRKALQSKYGMNNSSPLSGINNKYLYGAGGATLGGLGGYLLGDTVGIDPTTSALLGAALGGGAGYFGGDSISSMFGGNGAERSGVLKQNTLRDYVVQSLLRGY